MNQDTFTVIEPLPMFAAPWAPDKPFLWYYMRTQPQPEGFVIHLTQRVTYNPWKKGWLIGREIFPNVLEIRTATRQEVEAQWNQLRTATPAEVAAARGAL